MSMETINIDVNLKEYFNKMSSKDSAEITAMCLDKICAKADELRELYLQLARSYGIEMGIFDIALLIQVSAPKLSSTPTCSMLGTPKGIKHALAVMMEKGIKNLAKMEEEDSNDKKQS